MKRFRLNITDKFEDRPRLITAYGRVKGGEVGLVLRPLESRALVVELSKDSARFWENRTGPPRPGLDRYQGVVTKVRGGLRVGFADEDGERHELAFDRGTVGETVSVAVDLDGGRAYALDEDGVQIPSVETTSSDAVKRIRAAQKSPGKRGPATFRGQWTGVFVWDDGPPRVELRRKLASYGWLHIRSDEDGWRWMFDRQANWFTSGASKEGTAYGTLLDAIDAGVAAGLGLVHEACGVRDTTRKTPMEAPSPPPPVGPSSPAGSAARKPKSKAKRTRSRPQNAVGPRKARKARTTSAACACDADTSSSMDTGSSAETSDQLLMEAFAQALDKALAA